MLINSGLVNKIFVSELLDFYWTRL